MPAMKGAVLLGLTMAPAALAHTIFTNFFVNGVDQGYGTCVRMNKNNQQATYPVPSITSTDLTCGIDGLQAVERTCPVPDGATITVQYNSWDSDPTKKIIDPSHQGPCAIYAKKVNSMSDNPSGDGWFKIFEQGYTDGKWCVQHLIDNDGKMSVKLPSGLTRGYYLIRPELLALHKALENDPQFYTGCAQIFLEGNGNLGPNETVSIPGYVALGQKSVAWNYYYGNDDPNKYPNPGPKVATFVAGGDNLLSQPEQTEGLKPAGCILENANWCGFEVPDYTDETGCWASVENCWAQNKQCWSMARNNILQGCKASETRCHELENTCNSKSFPGPPNKGKVLTPAGQSAGNIANAYSPPVSGGYASSPQKPSASSASQAAPAPSSQAAAPAPSQAAPSAPAKPAPSNTPEAPADSSEEAAPSSPANYGSPAETTSTTTSAAAAAAPSYDANGHVVWVTTTVTELAYATVTVDAHGAAITPRSLHANAHRGRKVHRRAHAGK